MTDDLADLMAALLIIPDEVAREGLFKQAKGYWHLAQSAGFGEKRVVVVVRGQPRSKPPGDPRAAKMARELAQVISVAGTVAVNKLATYEGKPKKEENPFQGSWESLGRAIGRQEGIEG